jgi:D-xylose transport system permease protein
MSAFAEAPPAGPEEGREVRTIDASVGSYIRDRWIGLRGGDLGSIPIIVGIIAIAIYFQFKNDQFLTAGNFVKLIAQMGAVTIIGMGIVMVLLLGEIDLSVGYVSGIGGVVAAVLLIPDANQSATWLAVLAALGAGCAIGLFQGAFIAYVGVPSFVVTLAGLLAWNGVLFNVIGGKGTIVIQDSFVASLANGYMAPWLAWTAVIVCIVGYVAQQLMTIVSRNRAGLPNQPWLLVIARIVLLAAAGGFTVWWANQDLGVPYVGLLMLGLYVFWTFVLGRTRFGRHIYAVGGNAEAARRAGINVAAVKVAVFAICSTMAALGGIVLASRLNSVDTSTGGGTILLYSIAAAVIGGTSLFGGRGWIRSAVLGAVLITMIDNGLGLLSTSAGTKYEITGIVLLAAVTLDSVSRRRTAASGR